MPSLAYLKAIWDQYFPPTPSFTEKNIGNQAGKVFIVTGSNQGIGYELVKTLYPTGATIYMACRSEERAKAAMKEIVSISPPPKTPSTLKYLHLDLNDLTTIKPSAAIFASQESRLDIIWNNAACVKPPGSRTAQNLEAHIGVNCVAPLLFNQELISQLKEAAKSNGTARVIWTSSLMSETVAPTDGIDYERLAIGQTIQQHSDYGASKVGNYFFAVEMARRYGDDGIISVALNPGNLYTNIFEGQPWWLMMIVKPFLYKPKYGAYTMLYAGFTTDVTSQKNNGAYIYPWGYVHDHLRADVTQAIQDGGANEFWEWCERKYEPYL